jgi:hypothetical protein
MIGLGTLQILEIKKIKIRTPILVKPSIVQNLGNHQNPIKSII